ncbi:MAG TPA: HAD-IIIA family hydrolase [Cytophagaceae bacterium]|nr:HAD-IIIA family hydrolase [Cytophagaceae bacterium]
MNKCVFLDRDGVLNVDNVNYIWTVEAFKIMPGVPEALQLLKDKGYYLVIITNQSGIAKGIYKDEDVMNCHRYLQEETGHLIDEIYYSPYHHSKTDSLATKPGTLNFEKGIAKFNIDPGKSFMIGDTERDLIPAKKMGLKTFLIPHRTPESTFADSKVDSLLEACNYIP